MGKEISRKKTSSSAFKAGAVCLVFLVIGYQSALFIHSAARLRIESLRDSPDTVYVIDSALASRLMGQSAPGQGPPAPDGTVFRSGESRNVKGEVVIRRDAAHSQRVQDVRKAVRHVESFRFNPNTVSVEDLERLGFSEKQALSIDNYRRKGGRFHRPSDFSRSYVVADSVFRRLENFIDIPRIDINTADSASFETLPGIGPWFASRMVSYRSELGGYSYPEQLMDIRNFGSDRYDALKDLIVCSPPREEFRLWTLPAEELKRHPYIRTAGKAASIVLFRDNTPQEEWSVSALGKAGILDSTQVSRLSRCRIESP